MREILIVGSVALDDLETPMGKRSASLGGSATYFSVSASLFAPVSLVAVVGEDFPQNHIEALRSRGINLEGLERVPGLTFRWGGRYGEDLGDPATLYTQLNVFEHFDPKIPPNQRKLPLVFLGNIQPSLQLKVLDQLEKPELVGLDTMNFWILERRDKLLEVLKRVDLLVINETEARLLSGERNVHRAAKLIRAMGPRFLVIKRGAHGALLYHPEGSFFAPAMPLEEIIDPTGAGDSFAAGFMGSLAQAETLNFGAMKRATLAGTVTASFACQGFSLDRPLSLSFEELKLRIAELYRLIDPN